jgi:hypothetical protein
MVMQELAVAHKGIFMRGNKKILLGHLEAVLAHYRGLWESSSFSQEMLRDITNIFNESILPEIRNAHDAFGTRAYTMLDAR